MQATDENMMSHFVCEECGSVRMRTPSGTVCPNGHGMLHPPASAWQLKRVRRLLWMKDLPQAERDGRKLTVNGRRAAVLKYSQKSKRPYHVPTGTVTTLQGYEVVVIRGKGKRPLVRVVHFVEPEQKEKSRAKKRKA